jgi:predicted ATPase
MLVDLLTSYEDMTLDLAECIHKKTLGNIFYVIQYLRSLNNNDLLIFNIGVNKWTWKLAGIKAHTLATDNVVDFMKERLNNLPPGIRDIIPSIACLGSKFRFPIFQLVVEHFSEKLLGAEENMNDVYSPPEFLKLCENEGLIVDCGHGWFKWEHDKIQEAALLLVAEDELPL